MSEYIDKWYVIKHLINLENKFQWLKPFHGNEQSMYEKICKLEIFLGKTPAADVVPVVHGKWKESANLDNCFWICTECQFCSEATAAQRLYKYCPNCGAKMDLEEEQ